MLNGFLVTVLLVPAVVTGGDEFISRGGGTATTARISESGLVGPTIQMGRYGNALRGRAFGAPIEVSWNAERVVGLTGGAPVNLRYQRGPDGILRLDGMYAGNLTHLAIGADGVTGYIGPRDFALDKHDGVLVGLYPIPEQVEIPQALARLEVGEQAALLPVLLAGFAGPQAALQRSPAPGPRRPPATAHLDYDNLFRVSPPAGWPTARPAHHRPEPVAPIPVHGIGSIPASGGAGSSVAAPAPHIR
jgi:hypothetical protein